ncbi:MAG: hypothetical protein HYU73_22250, partial [Betaproteobacteria bacterium]|nr:hypothetical protein [Betaproteobacteria bacterium]
MLGPHFGALQHPEHLEPLRQSFARHGHWPRLAEQHSQSCKRRLQRVRHRAASERKRVLREQPARRLRRRAVIGEQHPADALQQR